jgi:hypothetical protein
VSGKQPAILFYSGDWKKDPQLSKCSLAARGAWFELLLSMHENGRTGKLTGTIEELAQLVRCTPRELLRALDELERTRAAEVKKKKAKINTKVNQSKTSHVTRVTVINRRMKREAKVRDDAALRMRRHRKKNTVTNVLHESHTTSSSSSSVTSSEEDLVSEKLSRERESSSAGNQSTLPEDFSQEYLDDLQDQKRFAHLDVREVHKKADDYYERRGMKLSRNKLVDWLIREIPNRKETGPDDDDRGTSAQAARVAAMLERDN